MVFLWQGAARKDSWFIRMRENWKCIFDTNFKDQYQDFLSEICTIGLKDFDCLFIVRLQARLSSPGSM